MGRMALLLGLTRIATQDLVDGAASTVRHQSRRHTYFCTVFFGVHVSCIHCMPVACSGNVQPCDSQPPLLLVMVRSTGAMSRLTAQDGGCSRQLIEDYLLLPYVVQDAPATAPAGAAAPKDRLTINWEPVKRFFKRGAALEAAELEGIVTSWQQRGTHQAQAHSARRLHRWQRRHDEGGEFGKRQ